MIRLFRILIILFKIFFTNRFYTIFHGIAILPFGIHVYAESIQFTVILLVTCVVSLSVIILLSSLTKLHDMPEDAGRMEIYPEFSFTFGTMIHYLFVF
jgi:cobalt/nickel transport system permease protein